MFGFMLFEGLLIILVASAVYMLYQRIRFAKRVLSLARQKLDPDSQGPTRLWSSPITLFLAVVVIGLVAFLIAPFLSRLAYFGNGLGSLQVREVISEEKFPIPEAYANPNSNELAAYHIVFSPDGSRVAFVTRGPDKKGYIIADGDVSPVPKGGKGGVFIFSADSEYLAYLENTEIQTLDRKRECCWNVITKKRGSQIFYTYALQGTLDGALKKLSSIVGPARAASTQALEDVVRSATSPNGVFSASASVVRHCPFGTGNTCTDGLIVRDTKGRAVLNRTYEAAKGFSPKISSLLFSPDSKSLAYVVGSSTYSNWFHIAGGYVVIGNTRGSRYDGIVNGSLQFSPDGSQISYGVLHENAILRVTEKVPPGAVLQE